MVVQPAYEVKPPFCEPKRGRPPLHKRREEDEMLANMGLRPPAGGRGRGRGRGRGGGTGGGRGGGTGRGIGGGTGRGRGGTGSGRGRGRGRGGTGSGSSIRGGRGGRGESSSRKRRGKEPVSAPPPPNMNTCGSQEPSSNAPEASFEGVSTPHVSNIRDYGPRASQRCEGLESMSQWDSTGMFETVGDYQSNGTYRPPVENDHFMRAPVHQPSQVFRPMRASTGKYIPTRPVRPPNAGVRPPWDASVRPGLNAGLRPPNAGLRPPWDSSVRPGLNAGLRPPAPARPSVHVRQPTGPFRVQMFGGTSQPGGSSQSSQQTGGSSLYGRSSQPGGSSQSDPDDWLRYLNSQPSSNNQGV